MKIEKQIVLKSGVPCQLRSPGAQDAAEILRHLKTAFGETEFLSRYPEECTFSVAEEAQHLESALQSQDCLFVSAVLGKKVVGLVGISPILTLERYRHRATLGISVEQSCWGLGIGRGLMQAAIDAAAAAGYHQLELEVAVQNQSAIALYKKTGFVRYGTREDSIRYRDGRYEALHLMLRRL